MYLILNNGGDSVENPILAGLHFRATLNKHNAEETLRRCWVSVNDAVFTDLTSSCVTTDYTIYIDLESDVDFSYDDPPVKNTLHFTTTNCHVKAHIYVATQPDAMVLLDGYNANQILEPIIVPMYGLS